jgi:metal-sulfur cluster biosynthetic enzyme
MTMIKDYLLTDADVRARLATVMDPELHVDIVSLGLIYRVEVELVSNQANLSAKSGTVELGPAPKPGQKYQVFITMTLTTPGCPLAGVFDQLVKESLVGLPDLDVQRDVEVELTFDPPWVPDMMTDEAKAELGFDD